MCALREKKQSKDFVNPKKKKIKKYFDMCFDKLIKISNNNIQHKPHDNKSFIPLQAHFKCHGYLSSKAKKI